MDVKQTARSWPSTSATRRSVHAACVHKAVNHVSLCHITSCLVFLYWLPMSAFRFAPMVMMSLPICDKRILVVLEFSFWTCHRVVSPWACCQWSAWRRCSRCGESWQGVRGAASAAGVRTCTVTSTNQKLTPLTSSGSEGCYHANTIWGSRKYRYKIWWQASAYKLRSYTHAAIRRFFARSDVLTYLTGCVGCCPLVCCPNITWAWSCRFSTWCGSFSPRVSAVCNKLCAVIKLNRVVINCKLMLKYVMTEAWVRPEG